MRFLRSLLGTSALLAATLVIGCAPAHTKLDEAAIHGDRAAVDSALTEPGVNINAHNRDHNTALHEAVLVDNKATVVALLDHGADPNAVDEDKQTPLHFAAKTGFTDVGTLSADHGGNV